MVDSKKISKILWLLVFLYSVVFPFGQLLRVPLGFASVHVADIIVGLIGAIWLIVWVVQKKKMLPPLSKEVICFFAALVFSFALAAQNFSIIELITGGLYLLRLIFYGLFYLAVWSLVGSEQSQRLLSNSLIVVGVVFAIFGWVQYFLLPDIRPFVVWGWDEHYLRLAGTFLDPGFTSIILVFLIMLLFSTFMPTSLAKYRGVKLFHIPGGSVAAPRVLFLCFAVGALLLTYSRAGYVSFIAGMTAVSLLRKNVFILLGAVLILGVGILLLPKNVSEGTTLTRTTSSFARFESWGNAVKIWETSPVFGVGFNNYQFALNRLGLNNGDNRIPSHGTTGSDSSLLFVLATTGVVGLLLFGHFALRMLTVVWNGSGPISTAFIASFTALFFHSFFLNSLFYPAVMGWMAILFALSARETMERR